MSKCCGNNVNASACFITNSKEYGFTSVPFQFDQTTTTTLWQSLNLPGLSGTVLVMGNIIAGTTRIAINSMNTTKINNNETFAVSINPLNLVVLTYTTANSSLSSINVSISAARFEY